MHLSALEKRFCLQSIALFFLLFVSSQVTAQQYVLVNYSIDRGLPGNQIWSIYQDSKGYMWFAATGGLARYDGQKFEKWRGLSEYYAHNVQEDNKGNLWAGCPGGVSLIRPDTTKNIILGGFDHFYKVFVDNYDRVWIYNFQLPGDLFVIENDSLRNYSKEFNLQKQRILHIAQDRRGTAYLLTGERRLYRFFSMRFEEIFAQRHIEEVHPRMFFFDAEDNLILCGEKGAARLKRDSRQQVTEFNWILEVPTMYGLQDRRGYYWFATLNDGLFRIVGERTLNITEENGLPTSHLYTLYEDRESNLWIGTNLRGIVKLSSLRFRYFGKQEGFKDDAILALRQIGDVIYCASEHNLYRFRDSYFDRIDLKLSARSEPFNQTLLTILPISNKRILLGGSTGVYELTGGETFKRLGLESLIVSDIFQDTQKRIWIGTNNGVYRWMGGENFVQQDFGYENLYINRISEIDNNLYLAASEGLLVLDNFTSDFTAKSIQMVTSGEGLISNNIQDVTADADGDIIIATVNGLNVKNADTIYTVEGLANSFINVVYVDSEGRLWAGTNGGLHLLQKKNGRYQVHSVFLQRDGLASAEFTRNQTIIEDEEGRIWFGTYSGLSMYNPAEEHSVFVKPFIHLSAIIVNDDEWLEPIPSDQEFAHYQNKFRFVFNAPSFFDEERTRFEYYLHPLEKPWVNSTHLREAYYSFLSPGAYSFQVRAINPFGVVSDPQKWEFHIEAPFWKRTWFFIMVGASLLLFGYLANFYRLQRIQENNRKLEQMVNEKTAELKENRDKIADQYQRLLEVQEQLVEKERLEKAYQEIEKLKNQLSIENLYLKERQSKVSEVGSIIGKSPAIQKIRKQIVEVAATDATVLITGETGTGKNLVAEAIHSLSSRRHRALVSVNCAAIPSGLIESELFGHEKGAFTGANERHIGKFEIADGSTIFLDEIGDMSLPLQAKLLTVLQERKFTRVGGNQPIEVEVRIIAATNQDLNHLVATGKFRSDLFYRLNVFLIDVPPLRDRVEDTEVLIKFFVDRFSRLMNKKIRGITRSALKILEDYEYAGNVRELENIVQRAVILCKGEVISDEDVIIQFRKSLQGSFRTISDNHQLFSLDELEKRYIGEVLEITGGRIHGEQGAAKILGINPSTLRSRMLKLNIPFKANKH